MQIKALFHVAIKTSDLDRTRRFYADVLGLRVVKRPAFDFPGVWLAAPGDEDRPLIHVYAGDAAREADGAFATGSGVVDHISVLAAGFHRYRDKLARLGLNWRENVLPEVGLWQIFVHDPNQVMIELTFEAALEGIATPIVTPDRQYRPREIFFDQHAYA
jgi:catechol 2,3-dioxygenase-like lactoylglutathione lyase family enzyme